MLPLPCLLVAAAAATLPIGEIGVASGKPLRGDRVALEIPTWRQFICRSSTRYRSGFR